MINTPSSFLVGKIIKRKLGRGSQKEKLVNALLTEGGSDLVVRREGGTAFQDELFDKLEGKKVRACGHMQSYVLIVENVEEIVSVE